MSLMHQSETVFLAQGFLALPNSQMLICGGATPIKNGCRLMNVTVIAVAQGTPDHLKRLSDIYASIQNCKRVARLYLSVGLLDITLGHFGKQEVSDG